MNRKGISLIEMLIAVTLISLVGAAIVSIDFANRMGFIQAGKRAKVSDEARFAMENVVRRIRLANSIISPVPPTGLSDEIIIGVDYDLRPTNYGPLNTPDDLSDDYEAWYKYDASNHRIEYQYRQKGGTWSSKEDIAPGMVGPANPFDIQDGNGTDVPVVTITITVVDRPTPPPPLGSPNNPRVTLESKASLWCKGRS